MTSDRPALAESIDYDAAEAVIRECLVVLGFVTLTGLALAIPGTGGALPGTSIAVADAIVGVGTVAVVGSMLHAVPRVRALVSSSVVGPETVAGDVAAIAGYLVAFGAVIVAYRGLAGAVVPLLDGATGAYDQMFLLFGAVVLALIARRMYRSLDPIAGLLTRELLHATERESSGTDTSQ